jgi:hypothetical protein
MTYNGYNISINDGYYRFTSGPDKGKLLHRIIWEEHNGLIPEGHDIHHKDEDKLNIDPENLECISHGEHSRLHKLGKYHSRETKKKLSDWNTGRTFSNEIREKMSKAQIGKCLTEEHKRKISEAKSGERHHMYGKHFSEEAKKKMSIARIGEKNPMYGKKFSKEYRKKLSEARKLYWQKRKQNKEE